MATYEKGILGAFTGTVGPIVGSTWRGKNVMRSRPRSGNRTPTEAQKLQREKFTTVTRFLTPIKEVLNRYFGSKAGYKSRYNLATSYHLKEAVQENGELFDIIYNKVLISKGDLQGFIDASAEAVENNGVKLSWNNNSGQGMASADDALLVVVFSEELQTFETFANAATRGETTVTVTLDSYFSGAKVHCWAAFVNDSRKLSALSTYLGELEIS